MPIFSSDKQVTVVTRGPGNLSLLTWGSNSGAPADVGAVPTTNAGLTRWLISFSHDFNYWAFKWDGQGEAVYQIGSGLERKPVGRDWTSATKIEWLATTVTTQDVSSVVSGATNRDGLTTAWIIPDTL
ncbi:mucin-binding lectin 1 [Coprinopsis sp. MPI-PUGE-AT-0042]|nr:mucin-binding lectin 1 [Coprinopsis sp. MPI-PUGE-AT-0042]KAH6907692.1 mucin-binding lectin 1 [Coprinopsis sp. MPI-PUGE-AT-0042]